MFSHFIYIELCHTALVSHLEFLAVKAQKNLAFNNQP